MSNRKTLTVDLLKKYFVGYVNIKEVKKQF